MGRRSGSVKQKVTMKEKCDQAVLKSMSYGYSRSQLQPTQPQGSVGGEEWKPIDCLQLLTVSSSITFDGNSLHHPVKVDFNVTR